MPYHHGVETVVLDKGPRAVREVRTAAIMLTGTAPIGAVNELTLVRSVADAAQFGKQLYGYTIPQALADIFKQGNALVAVCNVKTNDHNEAAPRIAVVDEVVTITGQATNVVTAETVTLVGGEGQTALPLFDFTGLLVTNSSGSTSYVKDTDFSIDLYGNIERIGTTIGATDTIKVTYMAFEGGTGSLDFGISGATSTVVLTNSAGSTTYIQGVDYTVNTNGAITSIALRDGSYKADYNHYESHTVTDMKFSLTYPPAHGGMLFIMSADKTVNYVKDTDYTIDVYGNVKVILGGDISEGDILQVNYEYFNPSLVTASEIVGEVTVDDVRSGMETIAECYTRFGFKPKLIIAPRWTTNSLVSAKMLLDAEEYRCIALFDSTTAWTVNDAIDGRGSLSSSNFATGSKRAYLLYPGVKITNGDTGAEETRPASPSVAGLIAKNDDKKGFWVSPSNKEMLGINGLETQVTWDFQKKNTQANALNEVGVTTLGKPYGSGFRLWGNRSAAYPTVTTPDNFICVQRTADILHESVEQAMLPFIDQPIEPPLIASIVQTVNDYINSLIQRGALIGGECLYDPAKNPAAQLGAGILVLDIRFMPPTPAENIRFESFIDQSYLSTLTA